MSKMKWKWLEDGWKLELMRLFKFALLYSVAIPTRNIDGRLIKWEIYEDDALTIKLFTQERYFTDGRVSQKITTDHTNGKVYTQDFTIINGVQTKVERDYN